ncbi:MAG: hypothetical protein HUU20_13235 [Pirellulales bacterium]|nr:hypothetical protein [Pirellulales bacterium]
MLNPQQVVDRYFLESRCQLLEIAATLDRYDLASRENGTAGADDPRWERLYQSLEILADRGATPDRAERLLKLFSDPAL